MGSAVEQAVQLIASGDRELLNILSVTARMSLSSSLIALLLGVPLGLLLGACRFPGRGLLLVLNRTLMGVPPVVCGLIFYILFSLLHHSDCMADTNFVEHSHKVFSGLPFK